MRSDVLRFGVLRVKRRCVDGGARVCDKRAVTVRALILALLVFALAAGSAAAGDTFRLPSKRIGCQYSPPVGKFPARLRCDVLGSGLDPRPRGKCDLDWTGLSMTATGKASPECAGDTAVDRNGPILAYGSKWHRGAFACSSSRAGLRCGNRGGHGFTLARFSWRVF